MDSIYFAIPAGPPPEAKMKTPLRSATPPPQGWILRWISYGFKIDVPRVDPYIPKGVELYTRDEIGAVEKYTAPI